MNKVIFHIVFICFSISFVYGQNLYDHKLDKNKWEGIKKNIQYKEKNNSLGEKWTYENNKEYQKALKEYQKKGNGNGSGNSGGSGSGNSGASKGGDNGKQHKTEEYSQENSYDSPNYSQSTISGLGTIGWIIIIVILVGLVILIVYAIVKNGKNGGTKVDIVDVLEAENISPSEIPLTELQRLLNEALQTGNYRAAVRIYYLFILKDLSHKKWIFWEKDKTNMHYLREMNGKSEFNDFNKAISYFEVVWYGRRDIDKTQFYDIQPNFTKLLDKLGVK